MHCIITAEQFYQDQKIQECGMLWEVAIRKWVKIIKHKGVTSELKTQKIEKALPFIKWENCII